MLSSTGTEHKHKGTNNNNIQPVRIMNNNPDNDDSVEEIESSQRVTQLYDIPANDSLNETIPFENKLIEKEKEDAEDKEGKDEAFEQLFSLIISPEDHCVICNTDISELDATVSEIMH